MNAFATTTSTVTSFFTVFTNLFTNNGVTLINVALIVATIGGQSILKKVSFACPCSYPLNVYQSLAFFIDPTQVNSTTWRLVHGCFYRHPDTRHNLKTVCVTWIEVVVQASVAPAVWLFVAFLDGSYYLCLFSADYCPMTAPQCKNGSWVASVVNGESMSHGGRFCPPCICNLTGVDATFLESASNVIAWTLMVYGACAFAVVCCVRMCDRYTFLQRKYVDAYKSEEAAKFTASAKEHAAQIADNNARAFFSNKDWSKKDWDWVSGVSEISNPFFARIKMIQTEKTPTTLYTPLQLWSAHKGYKILKPDMEVPTCVEDERGDHETA